MTETRVIKVVYDSIDGVHKEETFPTLEEAQEYAWKWVGRYPGLGSFYAVSDDGVARIMVRGATLRELFPGAE